MRVARCPTTTGPTGYDLIDDTLSRAQEAGYVPPGVTVDDVLLAWRMAFGVVVTAPGTTGLRSLVDRALGQAWALEPDHGRHRANESHRDAGPCLCVDADHGE
jgi:hypothetical protein